MDTSAHGVKADKVRWEASSEARIRESQVGREETRGFGGGGERRRYLRCRLHRTGHLFGLGTKERTGLWEALLV